MKNIKEYLLFDLDDTLLALNNSREITVKELFKNIIKRDFSINEIKDLIKENKQKDYFSTINYILRINNIMYDEKKLTEQFLKIYSNFAPSIEKFIITDATLSYLSNKYNLCLITGRPRNFLYKSLEKQLKRYFKYIVCHNDFENTPRKPQPEVILKTINKYKINAEYYIGNDVKDVIATKRSGLKSICTMYTSKSKDELLKAGCDIIIENINDIIKIL